MSRKIMFVVVSGMLMFVARSGWADVPAPPVNQDIGMEDVKIE